MKGSFRGKLILSIAFGALVYIGFTMYADAGKLIEAYKGFDWAWLPLVFVCTSTNYLFRFWKWDYYTDALGMRPPRAKNAIIFFAGFVMAVTPGKFGEVFKSYLLKQENGTPISRSAPIILAERITDFIGLIILVIAGAWVFGYGRDAVALFALFFFGVTALLSWKKGSLAIIDLLARLPLVGPRAHHLHAAYESIEVLFRLKPLLYATLLSVASWFVECLGYWIVLDTFHAPPTMFKATFIYAFSLIVGAVTMLPGGLGVTEGSLTGLAILAGAEKNIAVAATFIIRTATLWYAVVIGIVVLFAFRRKLGVDIKRLDLRNVESAP